MEAEVRQGRSSGGVPAHSWWRPARRDGSEGGKRTTEGLVTASLSRDPLATYCGHCNIPMNVYSTALANYLGKVDLLHIASLFFGSMQR